MEASNWIDRLDWVKLQSPVSAAALSRLETAGKTALVLRFHVDLKMIPVIEALARHFEVLLFPCHQDTTDSEGWDYLRKNTSIRLEPDWSAAICETFVRARRPCYLCDLGGEMIASALTGGWPVKGAMEGTSSGLSLLRHTLLEHRAEFPILDWNNARLKREIHNEKMVGFSIWQTFTEVTRLSLHGKAVGILGFGPVGRGIARTARSLGGVVRVFDPGKECRTLASYEGFAACSKEDLLAASEILVTATGRHGVLVLEDLARLPGGAILLNAGHSESEWAPEIHEWEARRQVLAHVERLDFNPEHHLYLLARGRLLNLAAGFGDTINAFDLTSAQLVAALETLLALPADAPAGLHSIDPNFFESRL